MSIKYLISKFLKKIQIPAIKNSSIDKKSKVCSGSHIVNSSIGKYSYVGNYSTVIDCKIGSYCSIADNCIIGGASHPTNWVSTSPVFYSGKNVLRKNFSDNEYTEFTETIIGNDVWIGSKCLIKGGVKIGNGAIIGMGSVVTHDVPPYEIWAGNPAKCIRKRFDDDTIERLLELKWWDYDDAELSKLGTHFNDVQEFLGRIKE